MIAGIKTATEAHADALVYQQLAAAPNNMGQKIHGLLKELMIIQDRNPTALSYTVPQSLNLVIPTAAIASILATWGYVVLGVSIPKPTGYTGNINAWTKITSITW